MANFFNTLEIQTEAYRPCIVKGKKEALFHRWAFDEKPLIHFKVFMKPEMMEKYTKVIKEKDIYPHYASIVPVKTTMGLVEYRDGSVDKVDPEDIRFLDGDYRFEKEEGAFWHEKETNKEDFIGTMMESVVADNR